MVHAPGSIRPLPLALMALVLLVGAHSLPPSRLAPRANFVGEGTNELATLMLQGYVDQEQNLAVSPLGYSVLLALLAEGARGETRRQLEQALHLPAERADVRQAYRAVLQRLQEKNQVNMPELRNWFYVYKNHSVEEEYRQVLRDFYFTDVKSVSRPEADMGFVQMGQDAAPPQQEADQEAVTEAAAGAAGAALEEAMTLGAMKEGSLIDAALQDEQVRLSAEKEKMEIVKGNDDKKPEADMAQETEMADKKPMGEMMQQETQNDKEKMSMGQTMEQGTQNDQEKMSMGQMMQQETQNDQEKMPMGQMMEQGTQNDQKKMSMGQMMQQETQNDQEKMPMGQMIEQEMQKPTKDDEMIAVGDKTKDETKTEEMKEDTKPIMEEKPLTNDKPMSDMEKQPETEGKPMSEKEEEQKGDKKPAAGEEAAAAAVAEAEAEEGEVMVTSERRKQRGLQGRGAGAARGTEAEAGLAAAAQADHLSGLSGNALVSRHQGAGARMLLFNGLYFRGSWSTPLRALAQREAFYLGEGRKVAVPMMRAEGPLRVGAVPELDCVAVELPYEGGRYALLALLPNAPAPGGLRALVADLAGYSLRHLMDSLRTRHAQLTLPCFAVETITRPIPTLAKFGVRDVFSKEKADLRGVSEAAGLYVQDLVQLVTVRVDNSSSSLNHITSTVLESRTGNLEKIVFDRPFLYFVRDTLDNLIVVAGKVVNPEIKPAAPA